ncbi:Glutathione import ATP-binding protein GsiA [Paraliobacillus sp. PM-2]|uniref:ABC transporter ATP-binding protein n=1 Tax=Paraliobacillus sp. PM-2 TaxID=1462524 RepID=UPI00061BEA12|nr:ATP-binding cassette domain-containing protein [Paraliobacillus sp. PM-2]CQR47400.1 Glutathione import ATP-binding protein GsiA [Paraliobacillus sp. PM-2]
MDQNKHNLPLLEVKDFSLSFRAYQRGMIETKLEVIKKLNLTIYEGEIVAVVGASGSGKSLLANAILGILPSHAKWTGELKYKGKNLTEKELKHLRGKEIILIPQSTHALNPLMKVGKQVEEAVFSKDKKMIRNNIISRIGLPSRIADQYPFELSGGMQRSIMGAIAMISPANLIIADEPTPGLDPVILKETTQMLKQLSKVGKGVMFISHDIRTALSIADRVVVFKQGETIEEAKVEAFTKEGECLAHAYTKKLWNALPENDFSSVKTYASSSSTNKCVKGNALRAVKLSYHYKGAEPLFDNLSLTITPGEIVGLQGYSGAGKTTLAKILAGYVKPSSGYVNISGEKGNRVGVYPVQLVWQHPEKAINPRWKMKKVLAESDMQSDSLLNKLGIQENWLSRWPSELSGGELQRFCIARALNAETKFLIADEMTTMLDSITQARLWEVVCQVARERQIGILAISHDSYLLSRISDRVIDFSSICHG